MLSLKKAADNSGKFTRTTDLNNVNSIVFAGGHTTMEYAMEVGVSTRRSRRRPDLELADNRTRSTVSRAMGVLSNRIRARGLWQSGIQVGQPAR